MKSFILTCTIWLVASCTSWASDQDKRFLEFPVQGTVFATDGAMQRNARAVLSNTAVASAVSESADGAAAIILYSKHCGSISDKLRTGATTIVAVVGTDIMVMAMYQLELKRAAIGDSLFCSLLKKSMDSIFE